METFINIWIVLIIISVIGFAIIPKVRTARREEREQREEEAKKEKYGKLLLDMKDKHLITEAQYKRRFLYGFRIPGGLYGQTVPRIAPTTAQFL